MSGGRFARGLARRRGTMRIGVIALLVVLSYGAAPGADELGSLGERVLEFARSHRGQKVGDGQCVSLATEALRAAGAAERGWGQELSSIRDVRPGDILQLDNAFFVRTRLRADGALVTLSFRYPHHVAIVSGVRRRGKKIAALAILHQNAGFDGTDDEELKVVQEWTIQFSEMKSGTLKAYRPTAK